MHGVSWACGEQGGVTREQRLSEEFHVKRAHGAICLRRIPKGYRGVGQWEQPDDIAAEPPTEAKIEQRTHMLGRSQSAGPTEVNDRPTEQEEGRKKRN